MITHYLIIFDLDDTLVSGPKGRPPTTAAEQTFMPGRLEVCAKLRGEGHTLAIATNQGGVAFGFSTREQAHARVRDAADEIRALHYALCVTHPSGKQPDVARDSAFRKPEAGMLTYLADACGFPLDRVVFVGDAQSDEQAAAVLQSAGVEFIWAEDFFSYGWERFTQAHVDAANAAFYDVP